jgi:hypothetical protein
MKENIKNLFFETIILYLILPNKQLFRQPLAKIDQTLQTISYA